MDQEIKDKTPYATEINKFPTSIGLTGRAILLKKVLVYEPNLDKDLPKDPQQDKLEIFYSDEIDNYNSVVIHNAVYGALIDASGKSTGVI